MCIKAITERDPLSESAPTRTSCTFLGKVLYSPILPQKKSSPEEQVNLVLDGKSRIYLVVITTRL